MTRTWSEATPAPSPLVESAEPARWIAVEVERAAGRLHVSVSTLLELFLVGRLDDETASAIEAALAVERLICSPTLGSGLAATDEVELRSPRYRAPRPTA